MKVRVNESVEIDVEVNVAIEDVLATLSEKVEGSPCDQLIVLDWVTKILERLPVECLGRFKDDNARDGAKKLARERLKAWKDCLFATDEDVLDASNLLCEVAIKRLPRGYRLSLAVEDGEASLGLEDTFEGDDIELQTPDGSAWLDAIATACDHASENRDGGRWS